MERRCQRPVAADVGQEPLGGQRPRADGVLPTPGHPDPLPARRRVHDLRSLPLLSAGPHGAQQAVLAERDDQPRRRQGRPDAGAADGAAQAEIQLAHHAGEPPGRRGHLEGVRQQGHRPDQPGDLRRPGGVVQTGGGHRLAAVPARDRPHLPGDVRRRRRHQHPALPAAVGAVGIVNLLRILTSNPQVWEKTAVIVSYDENGGFFDHVTPPTAPPGTPGEYIPDSVDINSVTGSGGIRGPVGLGYRVPCFVISPYSRGGLVAHETFDHTSQLRLVGRRFNVPVPNLTAWRESVTGDMTSAFNFAANPDSSHPDWGTPVLRALPGLPLCLPNEVLGSFNLGIPYQVPYPQTMPVQEATPARGTPSG